MRLRNYWEPDVDRQLVLPFHLLLVSIRTSKKREGKVLRVLLSGRCLLYSHVVMAVSSSNRMWPRVLLFIVFIFIIFWSIIPRMFGHNQEKKREDYDRLLTVRKSLHRSCWTEPTCQGIMNRRAPRHQIPFIGAHRIHEPVILRQRLPIFV